jgi:plastocyanin
MMVTTDRRTVLRNGGLALTSVLGGCPASTGSDDETETLSPAPATTEPGPRTVRVGADGELVFDPDRLTIPPGTTVEFVWDSPGHNIVVATAPEDADWAGTAGDDATTYDPPHAHVHSFDVTGAFGYYCRPHRPAGMRGRLVVRDS